MAPATITPVWLPIIEKIVFRFDASESARKDAAPSVSFEDSNKREEAIDVSSFERNEPQFIPNFSFDGANQGVSLMVSNFLPARDVNFEMFVLFVVLNINILRFMHIF